MKFSKLLLTAFLAFLVPVHAWSQVRPIAVSPQSTAAFDRMSANVNAIVTTSEKARWMANVALWKAKRFHTGYLTKADVDLMKSSHEAMKANVAAITEVAEKERWKANCDLWQFVLESPAPLTKAGRQKMQAVFNLMKGNVANIERPAEKERWTANRDLWTEMIAQM